MKNLPQVLLQTFLLFDFVDHNCQKLRVKGWLFFASLLGECFCSCESLVYREEVSQKEVALLCADKGMFFWSFERKSQVLYFCWLYFLLNQLQKFICQVLINPPTRLSLIELLCRTVKLSRLSLNHLKKSNVSLQLTINVKLHHLKDHKLEKCFLLSMEEKNLKDIVKKTRVREVQEEEDLILRKSRV